MRKTFLPRRSLFDALLALSWGGMIVGIALLALAVRLVVPNVFWTMATPMFAASDALAGGSRALFGSFSDAAALTLRVDRLTVENTSLHNENTALKARLEALDALEMQSAITAGVVARPPQSAYDTLIVAAGAHEGVKVGMEAFGGGGAPLGVVEEVWDNFARITLFSAPQREIAGWVGPRLTAITIQGLGGGALSATVASAANVAVGDVVYVPGPGALPFGLVQDIETNPSSVSMVLRIVPAVNLFHVTWVTVRETGIELPRQASATSTES